MNVDNGWYNHLEGGDVHAEEPWQREQNVGPAEETGYERKR